MSREVVAVPKIMQAVKNGMVRREGAGRVMVRKGVTTAHDGHPIVRSHPHLWGPVRVDFPLSGEDEVFDDAAAAAGLPQMDAIRALLDGLYERGYSLPDDIPTDIPADDLPMNIVRVALNNLPAAGEATNEAAADPDDVGRPADELHNPQGEDAQGPPFGAARLPVRADQMLPAADPAPTSPRKWDIVEGEPEDGWRTLEKVPAETTDPADTPQDDEPDDPDSTPEGRALIRAWAADNDIEVSARGPLAKDVVERYVRALAAED